MIKNIIFLIAVLVTSSGSFAASSEPKTVDESPEQELSLKKDREALDQLRQEVPEDVKRENDDLAFILKLFDDKKRQSGRIRAEFNKTYNRVRKKKQKEFRKERDLYTREEKSRRKKYLSESKKQRKAFLDGDASSEAKKEFFAEERIKRKEFFADEKDKRKDFESDLRARRKEFDHYLRDRRKDFSDRLRQFKKEQKALKDLEKKRKAALKKGSSLGNVSNQLTPKNQQYLNDFKKIPKRTSHTLAPTEEK